MLGGHCQGIEEKYCSKRSRGGEGRRGEGGRGGGGGAGKCLTLRLVFCSTELS